MSPKLNKVISLWLRENLIDEQHFDFLPPHLNNECIINKLYSEKLDDNLMYNVYYINDIKKYMVRYINKYKGNFFYNEIKCKDNVALLFELMKYEGKITQLIKNIHKYIYNVKYNNLEPDIVLENAMDHNLDKLIYYFENYKSIDKLL